LAETRLKIAVFIDFDNIEIGVKSTLGQHFDVGAVLEAIKERGEVVTKVAYGDWTRAGDYSRSLTQHAIHMVQRNLTPGGDKNGADINLALDALEMAFTHSHINAFVIVGGDSDFMALVEKLKQYDRKVFVVGGRAFTSVILQRNCTEFIAYENLVNVTSAMPRKPGVRAKAEAPVTQAVTLVRRALKVLSDREVSPQLGVLKSTLLQLDSTFSEREYGASTFRDFVQRLARAGYVTLKGTDRNIYVELREGGDGGSAPSGAPLPASGGKDGDAVATDAADGGSGAIDEPLPLPAASEVPVPLASVPPAPAPAATTSTPATSGGAGFATTTGGGTNGTAGHVVTGVAPGDVGVTDSVGNTTAATSAAPPAAASAAQAEGARFITEVFQRPGIVSRWPLYLRQVKQLLRSVDETFDERRYGFQGLVEVLRYCQREGLFRLDRDRQGVLRVYPGPALPRAVAVPGQPADASSLPPASDVEEPRGRSESRGAHHGHAAARTSSSGDLFDDAKNARTGGDGREGRAVEARRRDDADGADAVATAESQASSEVTETVGAAAAPSDASEPAAAAEPVSSGRASRRRRPGAIAAKPAAKKAAATPRPRGAKAARPRKAAKGKEKDAGASKSAAPDKA
jgi:uncharacterized LabA/DUF88 family protein